jgi:TRAF3-interacting protein 1
MDLDSLIPQVKEAIGSLISKPKMADKLLNKPPFRFLHDTITAVFNATGFGQGLYADEMLNSANVTDKTAKLQFLDTVINMVGICQGVALDIRSAKVAAGLEAECTNNFLLQLARCATAHRDGQLDCAEAVQRHHAGETAGSGPPVGGGGGGDSKSEGKDSEDAKPSSQDQMADAKGADQEEDLSEAKLAAGPPPGLGPDPEALAERGKSRGGTRGGARDEKKNDSAAAAGLAGMDMAPNLDRYIEQCDGTPERTRELLGALITRPKLADKLLNKPPFRFLHDIVMEIVRSTGFAEGLFLEEEQSSANVTDKSAKIQFLEKIIKVVGYQLNTMVEGSSGPHVTFEAFLVSFVLIILFVFCALFHARSNFSVLKFPLSLLHWIQLKTEQPGLRRSSLGLSLSIRTRGCS